MHDLLRLLEGRIMEELQDAQWYLEQSSKWETIPQIATNFKTIADEEIKHARMLCDILESLKKAGDISIGDKAIIEFLQEMNAERFMSVR